MKSRALIRCIAAVGFTGVLAACGSSASIDASSDTSATDSVAVTDAVLPPLTSIEDLPVVDTIPPDTLPVTQPPVTEPLGTEPLGTDAPTTRFGRVVDEGETAESGDSGPGVEQIQTLLRDRWGYVDVVADGVFGPGTERAVQDFQRTNGLTPDGIVGPETWAALRSDGT